MDALPSTWSALCALAFALGLRHGLDADHLATIDGLTRHNAHQRPGLARLCGVLFSLGHGAVVLLVAIAAATLSARWQAPAWLELTGIGVSVAFLFGLAFLNVRAVLVAEPGAVVATAGVRGHLLGRIVTVRRPWAVAAVGALFAISFDTVSQAALFALAASRFGGLAGALFVCGLFVLGMLAVDGANGLWINRLIRRADRTAVIASRAMALAVAGISFVLGSLTLAKVALPAVGAWVEGRELVLGVSVAASMMLAFGIGMTMASRRAPVAAAD